VTVADNELPAAAAIVKASEAIPLKSTVCGELGASSEMVTDAVRCPAPNGENVTERVQLALMAIDPEQPFARMKSFGLAPPRVTEKMLRLAVPELVTLTLRGMPVVPWVIVEKETLPGKRVTAEVAETPVPLTDIDCGLPGALSVTVREA